MDKNLAAHGIELHYGERATAYKGTEHVEAVVTDKGEYKTDLVINAIGFLPNKRSWKRSSGVFPERSI